MDIEKGKNIKVLLWALENVWKCVWFQKNNEKNDKMK